MRAAVYRHLDARATFAGLTFPAEWMIVIGVAFTVAYVGFPTIGILAGAAVYTTMRAVGYGKPEGHIQNYLMWLIRQLWSKGRLSSAARARTPRFPFAPYVYRDLQPRRKA